MKAKLKKEWIKALRSGDYTQTKNVLHREDGSMCCLGVLLDIYQDNHWELARDAVEGGIYGVGENILDLDHPLLKEMGLSAKTQHKLTTMNDRGDTFDEIADWVEETL